MFKNRKAESTEFYNYKRRHSDINYMAPHQNYNELKKVA